MGQTRDQVEHSVCKVDAGSLSHSVCELPIRGFRHLELRQLQVFQDAFLKQEGVLHTRGSRFSSFQFLDDLVDYLCEERIIRGLYMIYAFARLPCCVKGHEKGFLTCTQASSHSDTEMWISDCVA